jgi:hypothetical protein
VPLIVISFTICYDAPTFLKEVPGKGEPNPKPLHSGGMEHHISDLQERGGYRRVVHQPETPKQQPSSPHNERSEHYRREQERHSGVLENPIRVQRPLPQNPSEQRGVPEPSQPTPEELRQLARRVLSKPPMSAQQIEGIKPEDYEQWARNHPYLAASQASAMKQYEEAVEKLAQDMNDPFTLDLIRWLLKEEHEGSNPSEE